MRGYTMNRDDYLNRLRRIEGQVRGLQRMIERGRVLHRRPHADRVGLQGAPGRGPRPARRAPPPLRRRCRRAPTVPKATPRCTRRCRRSSDCSGPESDLDSAPHDSGRGRAREEGTLVVLVEAPLRRGRHLRPLHRLRGLRDRLPARRALATTTPTARYKPIQIEDYGGPARLQPRRQGVHLVHPRLPALPGVGARDRPVHVRPGTRQPRRSRASSRTSASPVPPTPSCTRSARTAGSCRRCSCTRSSTT